MISRTSRARTPAGLDSLGNAYNKCPVTPVRERMTVATWLSGDQTRDRELDDGNVCQQDLNEGYQEVDSSISGTDLGLSVEREITPWSPS